MIIDQETNQFKKCICGHTPNSYSIGYGRTPYNMECECGKRLMDAKCEITGSVENLFNYWNSRLRNLTIDEIKQETQEFIKERDRVPIEEGMRPTKYQYYWVKGKDEVLVKRWH